MKYALLAIPFIALLLLAGYINYQISFSKDGMAPLTFIEWIRVQNEAVNYEIEAA